MRVLSDDDSEPFLVVRADEVKAPVKAPEASDSDSGCSDVVWAPRFDSVDASLCGLRYRCLNPWCSTRY